MLKWLDKIGDWFIDQDEKFPSWFDDDVEDTAITRKDDGLPISTPYIDTEGLLGRQKKDDIAT